MSPEEKDQLVSEICEGVFIRLQDHRRIAEEQHAKDHDFVAYMRERSEKRAKTIENIKSTAIGAITLALLGSAGTALAWIGNIVLEHIKK